MAILTGAGMSARAAFHLRDTQVGLWAQYRPEDSRQRLLSATKIGGIGTRRGEIVRRAAQSRSLRLAEMQQLFLRS
jgi:hypothetical protein